jgi:hypothetical protein
MSVDACTDYGGREQRFGTGLAWFDQGAESPYDDQGSLWSRRPVSIQAYPAAS